MRVLITGTTGNVGREVVNALRGQHELRCAVRRLEQTPDGTEGVTFDFQQPQTFPDAVRGCEGLFLLRPPAIADVKRTLNPLIDAALEAGVKVIAFVSVMGAESQPWLPHSGVERHLRRRGAPAVILRPGFFAQNFQDAYRREVDERSRIYVPAARGRVAFIDMRDVAEVCLALFSEPSLHVGQAYTLTGPEAVDFTQAAAMLSSVLGREIRYEPASLLGYLQQLRATGLPLAQALVMTVLHWGLRRGAAERVDPTLPRLLGHPATPLSAYFERVFRP